MKMMMKCLLLVGICALSFAWRIGAAGAEEYEAVFQGGNYTFIEQPEYEVVYKNPPNYTVMYCGDGEINTGLEECDDANKASGDGCNTECQIEVPEEVDPDCYKQNHQSCEEAKKSCVDAKGQNCYPDYNTCLETAIQDCQPKDPPKEEPKTPPVVKIPEVKTELPAPGPAKLGVGMSGSGCSLNLTGDPWSLEGFIFGLGFLLPLLRRRR
jgi:hypothetical protein